MSCSTEIIFSAKNLLNKHNELVTKCRLDNKSYLANYKDIPPLIACLNHFFPKRFLKITAEKVSVFGVILVCILPHSDWIRRDSLYLSVRMRGNVDQNNSEREHFLRSEFCIIFLIIWGLLSKVSEKLLATI